MSRQATGLILGSLTEIAYVETYSEILRWSTSNKFTLRSSLFAQKTSANLSQSPYVTLFLQLFFSCKKRICPIYKTAIAGPLCIAKKFRDVHQVCSGRNPNKPGRSSGDFSWDVSDHISDLSGSALRSVLQPPSLVLVGVLTHCPVCLDVVKFRDESQLRSECGLWSNRPAVPPRTTSSTFHPDRQYHPTSISPSHVTMTGHPSPPTINPTPSIKPATNPACSSPSSPLAAHAIQVRSMKRFKHTPTGRAGIDLIDQIPAL